MSISGLWTQGCGRKSMKKEKGLRLKLGKKLKDVYVCIKSVCWDVFIY